MTVMERLEFTDWNKRRFPSASFQLGWFMTNFCWPARYFGAQKTKFMLIIFLFRAPLLFLKKKNDVQFSVSYFPRYLNNWLLTPLIIQNFSE
jgi:hypothetical protein